MGDVFDASVSEMRLFDDEPGGQAELVVEKDGEADDNEESESSETEPSAKRYCRSTRSVKNSNIPKGPLNEDWINNLTKHC